MKKNQKQKSQRTQNQPLKKQRSALKQYKIIEQIGKGSFGEVYLAQNIKSCQKVAIKKVKKTKLNRQARTHTVFFEKLILSKLKNSGIVKIIQTFQDQDFFYIVTEFQSRETLNSFIKKNKFLSQTEVAAIAAQLIKILKYLHERGFVHRDIKPDNIVIKPNGQVLLIDFGSCSMFKKIDDLEFMLQYNKLKQQFKDYYGNRSKNYCFLEGIQGTLQYLSPGQITEQKSHPEADYWALGVLIYKLLVGKFPFDGNTQEQITKNILEGNIKYPNILSNESKQVIQYLLDKNLKRKIQMKDFQNKLRNFNFFKEMDLKLYKQADLIKADQNGIESNKIAFTCFPQQQNIFQRNICYYGQIQQYYWYFFKTKPKLMVLEQNGTLTIFNSNGSEFHKLKLCNKTKLYSSQLSHLEIRQQQRSILLHLNDLSSLRWIRSIRSLIQFIEKMNAKKLIIRVFTIVVKTFQIFITSIQIFIVFYIQYF